MRVKLFGLLALCCVVTATILISGSMAGQSQKNIVSTGASLSQPEQELLNEINRARANPNMYAKYLEDLKPFFHEKEYKPAGHQALRTEEGWAAVEDAIKFLRVTKPLAPLTVSAGLQMAAVAHMKDQGETGSTGHQGANKSLIEERVKPYGTWQGAIGENLSYGNDPARERVLTWLIDDGFTSRGHRKRLLSNDYRVMGLSCGPHREYGAMCCLTLAGGFVDQQSSTTSSAQANAGTQTKKPKTTNGKAPK